MRTIVDVVREGAVEIDGVKYVTLERAEALAGALVALTKQFELQRRYESDRSWELERYREQERMNFVPDGAWA